MEKNTIELWALETLAQPDLMEGENLPLKRVRVYRELPEPGKSGKLLAALANAAQGQDLLWIIAPREGKKLPTRAELEKWRGQVLRQFEGVAPAIDDLRVETAEGKPALALHIETDRAPFVVYRSARARKDGSRPTDVLWMRNNRPEPARRVDLLKLVSPLRDLPNMEVIAAELTLYENANRRLEPSIAYLWSLDATVYVVPQKAEKLVLPFHKCRTYLESPRTGFRSEASETALSASKEISAISATDNALMINGVGQFYLFASGTISEDQPPVEGMMEIAVTATPAGFSQATLATSTLRNLPVLDAPNQAARWQLE